MRVGMIYTKFTELRSSSALEDDQKNLCDSYRSRGSTVEELQFSLLYLTLFLKAHYGKTVIILIDEYDDPINRADDEAERRRILDFMSIFLSSALKGNKSLRFTVITGVMQIAKEEIYSSLNHIDSYSIFDTCSTSFSDSPPTR